MSTEKNPQEEPLIDMSPNSPFGRSLAGLVQVVRARYPNVPAERGKAIMLDIFKKALEPGNMLSNDALLDELTQRFAAETA